MEDRSVVTIVVATMLSSSERVKRDLSAAVNELRGAYLAQRDWNQLDGLGRNPLVRLVLANFGGESKYAEKVAEQIRAYAGRDRSVIAVTGLGQSRETTQSALAVLGPSKEHPNGIPMVVSSLSSTNFNQKPYFFRIAPANDRQAQVAARMIEHTEALRGRPVHLVRSPGDEYSSDLADQFQAVLKPEQHDYDETANFADLEDIKRFADGRLYFTTFAWTPGREPIPQPTQQFFTTYEAAQKRHARRAFLSGPNGHILLAYDAVSVVARLTEVGTSREQLFDKLRTLRDFPGASGRLTFARPGASDTSGANPADKLAVGQIVKLDNGFLVSRYVTHEGT